MLHVLYQLTVTKNHDLGYGLFTPTCAFWHPQIIHIKPSLQAIKNVKNKSKEISHTGELILQGSANDSNLPSTFLSYNKLPALLTVPRLIPEQIDSKDKLLSHPLKPRCNCPPLL